MMDLSWYQLRTLVKDFQNKVDIKDCNVLERLRTDNVYSQNVLSICRILVHSLYTYKDRIHEIDLFDLIFLNSIAGFIDLDVSDRIAINMYIDSWINSHYKIPSIYR